MDEGPQLLVVLSGDLQEEPPLPAHVKNARHVLQAHQLAWNPAPVRRVYVAEDEGL